MWPDVDPTRAAASSNAPISNVPTATPNVPIFMCFSLVAVHLSGRAPAFDTPFLARFLISTVIRERIGITMVSTPAKLRT